MKLLLVIGLTYLVIGALIGAGTLALALIAGEKPFELSMVGQVAWIGLLWPFYAAYFIFHLIRGG